MKLEFHPEAELELIEAAVYYENEVPGLGERFEAEVRRATSLLLEYPEAGTPADQWGSGRRVDDEPMRECGIASFPRTREPRDC